jgi:uncharacterized protein (TIGR02217 family)
MAVAFDEVRLPEQISFGAEGGPCYSTTVISTASGDEQRIAAWAGAHRRWDISFDDRDPARMDALLAFFVARSGRLRGFRFKDWSDYKATAEALVDPYPTGSTIQLTRTYTDTGDTEVRNITKPVNNGSFVLYKDGTALTVTTDYSIVYTTGIVTLVSCIAAAVYTWSGEFDTPVRFDTDVMDMRQEAVTQRSWSVPIVEVLV